MKKHDSTNFYTGKKIIMKPCSINQATGIAVKVASGAGCWTEVFINPALIPM
jgi:hypothetical protein